MRRYRLDKPLQRHVYLEIDYFEASALDHHRNKVFTDVVHISLHGTDDCGAEAAGRVLRQMRLEHLDALLHRARGDQHLRHKSFAAAEAFSDECHRIHHAVVENLHRVDSFVDGGLHEFDNDLCFSGFDCGENFFYLTHKNSLLRFHLAERMKQSILLIKISLAFLSCSAYESVFSRADAAFPKRGDVVHTIFILAQQRVGRVHEADHLAVKHIHNRGVHTRLHGER